MCTFFFNKMLLLIGTTNHKNSCQPKAKVQMLRKINHLYKEYIVAREGKMSLYEMSSYMFLSFHMKNK